MPLSLFMFDLEKTGMSCTMPAIETNAAVLALEDQPAGI